MTIIMNFECGSNKGQLIYSHIKAKDLDDKFCDMLEEARDRVKTLIGDNSAFLVSGVQVF